MKLLFILIMIWTGGIAMAENSILVEMKTSEGSVTIELYADKAPITVGNFLKYVDEKFYDGIVFHRIINDFMVQAGGFTTEHKQKQPTYPSIHNEANNGLSNIRGSIAMARTNAPHSASSQFFINVKDNDFLDYKNEANYGYCVFGKVVSGLDVIDKMKVVGTQVEKSLGMSDWPVKDVTIHSIRRVVKK
jgi:peptidyl-prolyl cis-trans isomerase B (cyclophilin B)